MVERTAAASSPGHDGAAVEDRTRRARVIALLLVMPALLVSDLLADHLPWPVLAAHALIAVGLLAVTAALVTHRLEFEAAGRAALVGVALAVVVSTGVCAVTTDHAAALVRDLTMFHLWQLGLLFPLCYIAFDPSRALRVALALFAVIAVALVAPLAPELLAATAPDAARTLLRVGLLVLVGIALLHALAQTREQLAATRVLSAAYAEQARTDVLTGLDNRRRLEEVLADNAAEAARYGTPLSLVLADVDRFKAINDRYGHAAGDAALAAVADRLAGCVRDADLVGRWGGEEFLVVAPQTAGREAATLAERCRAEVAARPVPGVGTTTISFGVAEWRPGESIHSLLTRADRALYEAKRRGRDLVVIDDDDRLIDLDDAGPVGDDEEQLRSR